MFHKRGAVLAASIGLSLISWGCYPQEVYTLQNTFASVLTNGNSTVPSSERATSTGIFSIRLGHTDGHKSLEFAESCSAFPTHALGPDWGIDLMTL